VKRNKAKRDKGGSARRVRMTNPLAFRSAAQRVVKGGIDHVSRKIKQPFHNSRKIQNHGSRGKKWLFHISQEIKRADHGSRKYPLPPSVQCGNIMVFLLKTVQQTSIKLSEIFAKRKKLFNILRNGIEII